MYFLPMTMFWLPSNYSLFNNTCNGIPKNKLICTFFCTISWQKHQNNKINHPRKTKLALFFWDAPKKQVPKPLVLIKKKQMDVKAMYLSPKIILTMTIFVDQCTFFLYGNDVGPIFCINLLFFFLDPPIPSCANLISKEPIGMQTACQPLASATQANRLAGATCYHHESPGTFKIP